MRSLVVEDEFTSRKILQHLLLAHGDCHVAVNGREAVEAFELAFDDGRPYELICLDILLPELDGQGVLKQLRAFEKERGVPLGHGAKVIMTTGLNDAENVMDAFKTGCESYLVKPIAKDKVLGELRKLGLLHAD